VVGGLLAPREAKINKEKMKLFTEHGTLHYHLQ